MRVRDRSFGLNDIQGELVMERVACHRAAHEAVGHTWKSVRRVIMIVGVISSECIYIIISWHGSDQGESGVYSVCLAGCRLVGPWRSGPARSAAIYMGSQALLRLYTQGYYGYSATSGYSL